MLSEHRVLRHQPHGPGEAAVPHQGLGAREGVQELEQLLPGHLLHVAQLDPPHIEIRLALTHLLNTGSQPAQLNSADFS